jgi:hypothetical protein
VTDHDFDSAGPADIAVGLKGLRTFKVVDDQLASVVVAGHWAKGACIATCMSNPNDPTHEVPAKGCSCGIYAANSLTALFRQFREEARQIICVIAAEGPTVTGQTGLRTAAARIVAWWAAEPDGPEAAVCARECPGARRFYDAEFMARIYRLGG